MEPKQNTPQVVDPHYEKNFPALGAVSRPSKAKLRTVYLHHAPKTFGPVLFKTASSHSEQEQEKEEDKVNRELRAAALQRFQTERMALLERISFETQRLSDLKNVKYSYVAQYREYLTAQLKRSLLRFPHAINDRENPRMQYFLKTLPSAKDFQNLLKDELDRHHLSHDFLLHPSCGHGYFLGQGSNLQKSVLELDFVETRKYTLDIGSDGDPRAVGLFWDLRNFAHDEVVVNTATMDDVYRKDSMDLYGCEENTAPIGLTTDPMRFSPLAREMIAARHITHLPYRAGEGYFGLSPHRLDLVRYDVETLECDSVGNYYGDSIKVHAVDYAEKILKHKCVICRSADMGHNEPLVEVLLEYYTFDSPNGMGVQPSTFPPQPWSREHVWRMINLSLFSLQNRIKYPTNFYGWLKISQPQLVDSLDATEATLKTLRRDLWNLDNRGPQ